MSGLCSKHQGYEVGCRICEALDDENYDFSLKSLLKDGDYRRIISISCAVLLIVGISLFIIDMRFDMKYYELKVPLTDTLIVIRYGGNDLYQASVRFVEHCLVTILGMIALTWWMYRDEKKRADLKMVDRIMNL